MVQESRYQKWIDIINNNLNPRDFQYLCSDILERNKFISPSVRGKSSDGGRDIEADFQSLLPNGEVKIDKCWISCKKQKDGVNWTQVSQDVTRAKNDGVDQFIIMSNNETTSPCQDEIKKWNKSERCTLIDWSGKKLIDSLWLLPDICKFYFPSEEPPQLASPTSPKNMLEISEREGSQLGIRIQFKVDKTIDPNNVNQVSDFIKQKILEIKNVDINVKSLLYEKISMLFFRVGKIDDALMFLDKSIEITPNNESALLSKGYILEKQFQLDDSDSIYKKILSINPKNIFALNNLSHNLILKGEYKQALDQIEEALKINDNFIISIKTKAEILKKMGNEKEALAFLDGKDDTLGDSIILKFEKVDILTRLIDLKKAFSINEEILNKYPNYIVAINQKGVIYERNAAYQTNSQFNKKYLDLALKQFDVALDMDEKFSIGWSNKAVIYLNMGKTDQAKDILNTISEILPLFPQYWNKLGVCYSKEKKHKEALKCFDRALKMVYDEEFIANKLLSLYKLRKYDDIINVSERAVKDQTIDPQIWGLRGKAFRKKRLDSKADKCFKNAEKYRRDPISLLDDPV